MGINESELSEWNKRPADMGSFLKEFQDPLNIPKSKMKLVLEDAKRLGDLRLKELNSNSRGYSMKLQDDAVWDRIVPKLNMFNEW